MKMKKAKQEELFKLLRELTTELSHLDFIARRDTHGESPFMMVQRDKLLERARDVIRDFDK